MLMGALEPKSLLKEYHGFPGWSCLGVPVMHSQGAESTPKKWGPFLSKVV